jgi:hypothetical protein
LLDELPELESPREDIDEEVLKGANTQNGLTAQRFQRLQWVRAKVPANPCANLPDS